MRKVILLEHVSLDGYVAGPNGEMDWITFDEPLTNYVHALHARMDAAVYGRKTYEMMHGYWPTVLTEASPEPTALEHAQWLDKATKIVISKSLDQIDWGNSILIHDHILEAMTEIKQQPGKDIFLVGSISIAQELMRLGLIDEYWINVNPVVLGSGAPLFGGLEQTLRLNLVKSQTFDCGVVALQYVPASES
jgi:dihydrofolate reductase